MSERVLQVRKEPCRVEEFGSLQSVEQAAKLGLCQPANRMQEGKCHVVPDYGRLLQQVLSGGGQRVDTRSEDRLHRGRNLGAGERPGKAVAAAYPLEHGSIDQPSHDLFDEERIPAGALHEEALQRGQAFVGAQQGLEEFREALTGKGIQTQLKIIRPVRPFVPVFWTEIDHQKQASILCGYDHLVQQTEGEQIVPVKVLEDSDNRSARGSRATTGERLPDTWTVDAGLGRETGTDDRHPREIEKVQNRWNRVLQ